MAAMAPRRPKKPSARRAELIARVHMAGRVLSTAAVLFHATLAARQGLSATDEKSLDLVDRFGPLTAGDLARRTGLAPASITGLISRLEQKGLVRRVPDPADGRRVLIELDRQATARHLPLFADLLRRLEELYDRYSDDELELIAGFITEAARRQQEATEQLAAAPASSGT